MVMLLIVAGGLGWRVTSDLTTQLLRRRRSRRRLSLHSRLVLRTTLLLIAFGAGGLALTEWLNQGEIFAGMPWSEWWLTALFESVTARTAGFTTVPLSLDTVTESSLLLLMVLMFIGASPPAPKTINSRVVRSTRRECRLRRRRLRRLRSSCVVRSLVTRHPKPPATISSITTAFTTPLLR